MQVSAGILANLVLFPLKKPLSPFYVYAFFLSLEYYNFPPVKSSNLHQLSWQNFWLNLFKGLVMYLLETANELTARIQEIAFGLSIIISALFLLEYKKYSQEMERAEMIDNFLNEN